MKERQNCKANILHLAQCFASRQKKKEREYDSGKSAIFGAQRGGEVVGTNSIPIYTSSHTYKLQHYLHLA